MDGVFPCRVFLLRDCIQNLQARAAELALGPKQPVQGSNLHVCNRTHGLIADCNPFGHNLANQRASKCKTSSRSINFVLHAWHVVLTSTGASSLTLPGSEASIGLSMLELKDVHSDFSPCFQFCRGSLIGAIGAAHSLVSCDCGSLLAGEGLQL